MESFNGILRDVKKEKKSVKIIFFYLLLKRDIEKAFICFSYIYTLQKIVKW